MLQSFVFPRLSAQLLHIKGYLFIWEVKCFAGTETPTMRQRMKRRCGAGPMHTYAYIRQKETPLAPHTILLTRVLFDLIGQVPAIAARIKDTKAARETQALGEFYAMLGNDSTRAFYGPGHVLAAAEMGECLSECWQRQQRWVSAGKSECQQVLRQRSAHGTAQHSW